MILHKNNCITYIMIPKVILLTQKLFENVDQ